MKNTLLALIAVLIIGGGYFLYSQNTSDDVQYESFSDSEAGVAFEYKTEPDGYVLEDLSSFIGEQQEGTEVVSVYRLMNAQEKAELEASEGGREGPPTITLMIFKNLQNQSASMWVDSFPLFSNTNLVVGDIDRDAVVGGANAVRYRTDGLYMNQNVVVANGRHVYLFIGSFLEEDSAIYRDFNVLIDSVEFIPIVEEMSGAKIDVRVACESALAYMLFESGEDAEAFIEACIDGKHPEVIERYINDMGLNGEVI